MIKLLVIGNLGKDAQVNNVNGNNVINFNVAHTEKYKDRQGNSQDKTIWVECAYWNERTGIAPYLKKGTQVYVEGSPEVRTYTTNDNRHGASLTLRVFNIQLLGSRNDQHSGGQENDNDQRQSVNSGAGQNEANEPADDLPF